MQSECGVSNEGRFARPPHMYQTLTFRLYSPWFSLGINIALPCRYQLWCCRYDTA